MANSQWTTIAANTGNPPDTSSNVSIVQTATGASGINGYVRHECLMWLDGTSKHVTPSFNWAINGNFSVMLNATLNDITADADNVDVDIEGSVDGTNYIKLYDLIAAWNAGGGSEDEVIGSGIYDFESYGVMPYMRIALTPGGDANCTAVANNIKINVFMHNNT
mgnify:CR=1 FL=1|tara:strand:- start:3951 stop:4442 length:492 start_codon:yes stop_codon:yes gene_type:complete